MEHGRTGQGYGPADTRALEGMLADFLGLNTVNPYDLASTNFGRGGPQAYIWPSGTMSQYLDGHRVLKKKKLVSTAKPLAQTFLRHRSAANLTRLSKNLPSHQPIRLYLHTPHVLDHSLCSLFETALITHYLNFMLIDFLSAA